MQGFTVGQEIELHPISQKGKSRIAQHGPLWIVKIIKGTSLLVWSLNGGDRHCDKRWISIDNDKDFTISNKENDDEKDNLHRI